MKNFIENITSTGSKPDCDNDLQCSLDSDRRFRFQIFLVKALSLLKSIAFFFALLISLNLGKMFIFSLKIQQGHRQYIIELLPFDFWQRYQ